MGVDCRWFEERVGGEMGGGEGGKGKAYASAVGAIALVAEGAFTHDAAVGVGGFVGGDVAGAAAAVGDAHCCCCCGVLRKHKRGSGGMGGIFSVLLRAMLDRGGFGKVGREGGCVRMCSLWREVVLLWG